MAKSLSHQPLGSITNRTIYMDSRKLFEGISMSAHIPYRNLVMILVGVICLLLKRWFANFLGDIAFSYVGNLSASFAMYFLVLMIPIRKLTWVMVAVIALVIVETFELTNGFGIMTNVYDPFDYAANVIGIGLAVCVDQLSFRIIPKREHSD